MATSEQAMLTSGQLTDLVRECMSLQIPDPVVDYDTPIVVDSFSFIWLQHALGQRFGVLLEAPESGVLDELTSSRAVHGYLAALHPAAVEPVR